VWREDVEAVHADGVDAVLAVIRRLEDRIEEFERRLNRDSGNSSMPPSSDPPKSRAERRRAAREAYKRSMRSSGGQPGHEGKARELVAPDRVDGRREYLPDCCGCGHVFDGARSASAIR
jgi:transposase